VLGKGKGLLGLEKGEKGEGGSAWKSLGRNFWISKKKTWANFEKEGSHELLEKLPTRWRKNPTRGAMRGEGGAQEVAVRTGRETNSAAGPCRREKSLLPPEDSGHILREEKNIVIEVGKEPTGFTKERETRRDRKGRARLQKGGRKTTEEREMLFTFQSGLFQGKEKKKRRDPPERKKKNPEKKRKRLTP